MKDFFKRLMNWSGIIHSPSVYSRFAGKPTFKEAITGANDSR